VKKRTVNTDQTAHTCAECRGRIDFCSNKILSIDCMQCGFETDSMTNFKWYVLTILGAHRKNPNRVLVYQNMKFFESLRLTISFYESTIRRNQAQINENMIANLSDVDKSTVIQDTLKLGKNIPVPQTQERGRERESERASAAEPRAVRSKRMNSADFKRFWITVKSFGAGPLTWRRPKSSSLLETARHLIHDS